jgi:hypothetical protein
MRARQRNPWDIYADEHKIDEARKPKTSAPPGDRQQGGGLGDRQQGGGLFDHWERRGERQRTQACERSPVARELRVISFLLAVILILLALWLKGAFNGGGEPRTVYVHYHGTYEVQP